MNLLRARVNVCCFIIVWHWVSCRFSFFTALERYFRNVPSVFLSFVIAEKLYSSIIFLNIVSRKRQLHIYSESFVISVRIKINISKEILSFSEKNSHRNFVTFYIYSKCLIYILGSCFLYPGIVVFTWRSDFVMEGFRFYGNMF